MTSNEAANVLLGYEPPIINDMPSYVDYRGSMSECQEVLGHLKNTETVEAHSQTVESASTSSDINLIKQLNEANAEILKLRKLLKISNENGKYKINI